MYSLMQTWASATLIDKALANRVPVFVVADWHDHLFH